MTEDRLEDKKKPPKPKSAFVVLGSLKPQNGYSSQARGEGYSPVGWMSTGFCGLFRGGSGLQELRFPAAHLFQGLLQGFREGPRLSGMASIMLLDEFPRLG